MSNLRFNAYAAAVLTSCLAVIGVDHLSAAIFNEDIPDTPGYLIEIASVESAGNNTAEEQDEFDLVTALGSADAAAGRKVAKKCVACHSFEQSGELKQGPPMWQVVGRDIASWPGFSYSEALAGLPGEWNQQALYEYLRSPKAYAPGTAMNFIGLKKTGDRVNIIAYLQSLSE